MSIQDTSDNISDFKKYLAALKEFDFELAYLALLTREGLKPLSRWEKSLEDETLQLLREMNLQAKRITRTTQNGSEVNENIFSMSPAYIELYVKRFENQRRFFVRLSSMLC